MIETQNKSILEYLLCMLVIVLAWIFSISSCQVNQPGNATDITGALTVGYAKKSATSIRYTHTIEPSPTSTKRPTPSETPIPSPSFSPTHESPLEIVPPYSDVLINIAAEEKSPLTLCRDFLLPGKVYRSVYPYDFLQLILSYPGIGYYYPTWSPDGQWIAFLAIDYRRFEEWMPNEDQIARSYESDAIWIMRSDLTDNHKVTSDLTRTEMMNADGWQCNAFTGVKGFEGWSPDSKWVAYRYTAPEELGSHLYIVNIYSGQVIVIGKNKDEFVWSGDSQSIMMANYDERSFDLIQIDNGAHSDRSFSFPDTAPARWRSDLHWNEFTGKFIVRAASSSSENVEAIWTLDLEEGTWQELIVLDPPYQGVPWWDTKGARAIACSWNYQDEGFLMVYDPLNWEKTGASISPDFVRCDSIGRFKDGSGNDIVGFASGDDRRNIWIASIYGSGITPQFQAKLPDVSAIVDFPSFGTSGKTKIIYLSWRP
jgi:hypothetical protein